MLLIRLPEVRGSYSRLLACGWKHGSSSKSTELQGMASPWPRSAGGCAVCGEAGGQRHCRGAVQVGPQPASTRGPNCKNVKPGHEALETSNHPTSCPKLLLRCFSIWSFFARRSWQKTCLHSDWPDTQPNFASNQKGNVAVVWTSSPGKT